MANVNWSTSIQVAGGPTADALHLMLIQSTYYGAEP